MTAVDALRRFLSAYDKRGGSDDEIAQIVKSCLADFRAALAEAEKGESELVAALGDARLYVADMPTDEADELLARIDAILAKHATPATQKD